VLAFSFARIFVSTESAPAYKILRMNNIRRRLARIDEQLAGGISYYEQAVNTTPLAFAAAGLIIGTLIQNTFGLPILPWLISLVFFAAAVGLLFAVVKRTGVCVLCALACFICLGAVRLISYYQPAGNDVRNLVAGERKLATIRGQVITEPYINRNTDWKFARFQHNDPSSSFYLKILQAETISGWRKAAGVVRVRVAEAVLDIKAGDYIEAYCWLDRFKKATNPGQFDIAKYLAQRNVYVAAAVQSRDGIKLLKEGQGGILAKLRGRLKETAMHALLGNLPLQEPTEGLLSALLLGYRGNIDSDTYRAFRETGLLHFISLSGMHLGILVGIIWLLCKTAGLMKPGRAIICIIAIGLFLLIVPARAPTLRAAIICLVFCISFFFRRHSNPLNTLSLAAIILLLIRPTSLFEAGWQLSFASVLGLLLFCRRIHFFLYEKITGLPWAKKAPLTRPFFRIVSRPGPYLLRLFSTGLTAWLGGAGVLLYHFYTINPFTSIWTVIAFPFVALILTVGYLKIILSFLLPSVAAVLGIIVTGLADFLIWIVKLIADLGISQVLIGHVSQKLIIFYYCVVLFIALAYFRRPLIKKAICTIMILAIIGFLGVVKWQRTHRDNLVINCLDVGHGQAILAQLPGRANCLFDAGSLYKNDIGRRVVAAFLRYSGISKVDAIVISHSDIDHINGIPEIVENCKVSNVYANNAFFADMETKPCGTAGFLAEFLCEKGLEIQRLEKNLNLNTSASIKILWPSKKIAQSQQLSDNDKSLVSLIEFGDRKILLCSDIEKFAQRKLLQLFPNLKADVVVVPHHGSEKTLDSNFLGRLGADILICSCDSSQYEKGQIIDTTQGSAKVSYTAREGCITVCVDKDGTVRCK